MAKKYKKEITVPSEQSNLILFFKNFCIVFLISFLIFLPLTSIISLGKVTLVKSVLKLIYGAKIPYIHPIPFYRNIIVGIPAYIGLYYAGSISKTNKFYFQKRDLLKLILGIFLLWILDVFGNLHLIIVTKMDLNTFLPNFAITFLLSIGSIFFPFLFWFLFYYRFPKN